MGFETWQKSIQILVWRSLNILYGIWNFLNLIYASSPKYSLNIPYGIWNSGWQDSVYCWQAGLNIPYGIWNPGPRLYRMGNCKVWTYPMGFETAISDKSFYRSDFTFEHTLWDLKLLLGLWVKKYLEFEHTLWDLKLLTLITPAFMVSNVWTYPMGFETGLEAKQNTTSRVWTYPMGFETRRASQ